MSFKEIECDLTGIPKTSELEKLIPSANSIKQETNRNETRIKELTSSIEKLNARIREAINQGKSELVFFISSPLALEDEIKEMYKRKGYKFKPIGMSGGVMQIGDIMYWY